MQFFAQALLGKMHELSPEELAYVTLVVGNSLAHPDGITAYEKLYDAVFLINPPCFECTIWRMNILS
jgi:hypothetical protein